MTAAIQEWIVAFAKAVRTRDYVAARALVVDHVDSFGTVVERVTDAGDLERKQWRPIWETTTEFAFREVKVTHDSNSELAIVIAQWSSLGTQGQRRDGRATLVLSLRADDRWRAIHTHFSRTPP